MEPIRGSEEERGATPAPRDRRRPYRRPRILHRQPLEVMASVCAPGPPPAGPAKGNPGVCPQGPISS
jgi:hypothetical protein